MLRVDQQYCRAPKQVYRNKFTYKTVLSYWKTILLLKLLIQDIHLKHRILYLTIVIVDAL